ncbi:MAG: metalloregulator ArsR/SmtB family transcription factor [Neomegalonema sp.]|nr:metalloregulator ArsR/SmtB family transcription factor [Neomegalonema sp.]
MKNSAQHDARHETRDDNAPSQAPLNAAPLTPTTAAQAFAALGSEPRLDVIRALVRAGPEGLTVGELLEKIDAAPSTLTHHLKFLAAAGLLSQERRGRSQVCRADFDAVEALAQFLTRECCRDRAPLAKKELDS